MNLDWISAQSKLMFTTQSVVSFSPELNVITLISSHISVPSIYYTYILKTKEKEPALFPSWDTTSQQIEEKQNIQTS